MSDATVPRRTCSLRAVPAQRPGFGIVDLHVKLRVVLERHAGLGIEPLGPVQIVDVLAALDEFASGPIQRIEKPVASEMADDLSALAINRGVVQHVDAHFVVVPRVVRRVLEVPSQLAGVDIQRHRRVGVEIVAGTRLRIVLRDRVAGTPDGEFRCGVVGAGLPETSAARLPGVILVLPGFAARFTRLRHRVPPPEFLTGPRVECRDPAARFCVACPVSDDDLAVGRNRSRQEFFPAAELVGDRHHPVPHDFALVAVDCNHAAVGKIGNDKILP